MEVVKALHMNAGAGETSYAKNSTVQKTIISLGKPVIEEALEEMLGSKIGIPESMGIADLGCSSGPNTLVVISEIIDMVHRKCRSLGRSGTPEFTVYLNDLFTNDFNNVFVSLPDFYKKLKDGGLGSCFVLGVPGSFYGRIFPSKSVHFLHSSSSLHWLSQIPLELQDKTMNKGKIYISKSSPESVLSAYALQFHNDFSVFLRSRSEEMVAGGRMVLSLMGRRGLDPTTEASCYQWELLAQALMILASKGLVDEEKVDSFNAPYYAPCPEEIVQEAEMEGSFYVDRLEAIEIDWDGGNYQVNTTFDPVVSGLRVAKTIRAVVESMLECYGFGNHIMDDLFRIYRELVVQHLSKSRTKYTNLVIAFTRKA